MTRLTEDIEPTEEPSNPRSPEKLTDEEKLIGDSIPGGGLHDHSPEEPPTGDSSCKPQPDPGGPEGPPVEDPSEEPFSADITEGSGNVFRDAGFEDEAENLKIRANLMVRLRRLIKERGMTQQEAADLFGVSQPRVSDLVNKKIEKFSIDTLVNMLTEAGVRVEVSFGGDPCLAGENQKVPA